MRRHHPEFSSCASMELALWGSWARLSMVGLSCQNNIPHTRWVKQGKQTSLELWKLQVLKGYWQVKIRHISVLYRWPGSYRLISCFCSFCVPREPASCRDTSQTGLHTTLTHVTLLIPVGAFPSLLVVAFWSWDSQLQLQRVGSPIQPTGRQFLQGFLLFWQNPVKMNWGYEWIRNPQTEINWG